ncbi:MAG: polysaccharide pyruvyl transferase family protein, partial [Pseudomonadota bacterium]
MKNIKILITDLHCSSNRGDAAILEGMLFSLKRYFPQAEFTLLSDFPIIANFFHEVKVFSQPFTFFSWGKIKEIIIMIYLLIGALCYRYKIILPRFRLNKILPYLDADIIISKGGGFINDYYTPEILGRLWSLYFSKLLGKHVIIYAQSIGPLNKLFYRKISSHIFNKIDLIMLRDEQSQKILKSIGVTNKNIYVTADAAFAIPLFEHKLMQELRSENIAWGDGNNLKISISARKWDYYTSLNGHRKYIDSLAALADWLVEQRNAHIFFISTCTSFGKYHHDDRLIAYDIVKQMRYYRRDKVKILFGEYLPQELSNIYKVMDLHIGTRMHSNILALLAGVPVVAIQYEFKTNELMKFIGLDKYVV